MVCVLKQAHPYYICISITVSLPDFYRHMLMIFLSLSVLLSHAESWHRYANFFLWFTIRWRGKVRVAASLTFVRCQYAHWHARCFDRRTTRHSLKCARSRMWTLWIHVCSGSVLLLRSFFNTSKLRLSSHNSSLKSPEHLPTIVILCFVLFYFLLKEGNRYTDWECVRKIKSSTAC